MTTPTPTPAMTLSPCPADPATCSALQDVQLVHVALDMQVHMDRRVITSVATLHLQRSVSCAELTTIQLDVFHLRIHAVRARVMQATAHEGRADGESADSSTVPLQWAITPFTTFGEILALEIPETLKKANLLEVLIDYETSPSSPAVCWLEKEQTAGKTHPFVYTQGQEVLNRSFFPCQDSPSVRITYDAKVTVPSELVCVMSADRVSVAPAVNPDGSLAPASSVFKFEMRQSIPVYLVAMAVGNLASIEVGPRSAVWTEPCMLERCKLEFDGIIEKYLSIGERLFGDYLWERYDVLVMPPSFPYGGMENPRLTFISPCLITGDRSLLSILAHEISHSWFGNLVTNASWSDFFLNEGFTMYAERRITAEAHGRALMCLNAKIGEALLTSEITSLGEDSPLTRLRVPLETGIDPGDCYNQCAYEKGYDFVCYLRSLVDSDEVFDRFLRDYTQHFKFRSIAAEEMIAFFLAYFPSLANGEDLKGPLSFATWLHEPGHPPFTPDLSEAKELMGACETLVYYWRSSTTPVQANVIYLSEEAKQWPVFQLLYFLDCCFDTSFADKGVIISLGETLGLWDSKNTEVLFRWSQVLIKNRVEAKLDYVQQFLTMQGKQKFQIPIYRLMVATEAGAVIHAFAKDVYAATKAALHVMVRDRIEALLAAIA